MAKVNRTDGGGGSQETIRERRRGDCRGKAQILGQQAGERQPAASWCASLQGFLVDLEMIYIASEV